MMGMIVKKRKYWYDEPCYPKIKIAYGEPCDLNEGFYIPCKNDKKIDKKKILEILTS
jgi:hypothetical protein